MKDLTITSVIKVYEYDELNDTDRALLDDAIEATRRSYAPYSHFSVGAAALLANGVVVTGTNQENALSVGALCRTYYPILCQLPTSRPGSNHPRHCRTQRAQRIPGVSHPSLRRLPASDARNGEALQASHEGVAIWQKGNLRAEECGRITATLVRCFGHEVTVPIKY